MMWDVSAQTDAVEAAAADLYGLPPDEFTAARNARAKQVRAGGDKDAAAAIAKLAKPNMVAWLANQLVREHSDELGPLLEVGDAMREATAALNADHLRQLSRQQRQIVQGLVQQARELARAAGQAVSDGTARGLEETLHAALADEHAAQELSKGTLSAGLSRSGFPGMESGTELGSWAAAPRAAPGATPAAGTRARQAATSAAGSRARRKPESPEEAAERAEQAAVAARREKADRARGDEAAARSNAESARQALDQARTALADAERAADEAASDVERLQSELGAAMQAQSAAAGAKRKARREVDVADRIARQSERRLRDAAARLAELQD
jgi:hypothetical protein